MDSVATRSKSQSLLGNGLEKKRSSNGGGLKRDKSCMPSCPKMANGRKQTKAASKRQAEADGAAQRFGEQCPKCGSDDVKTVEPFNPVHADGIYCSACGRHSFPHGS